MPEILILGTLEDPHVERVVRALEQQHGVSAVVIDHLGSTETALTVDQNGDHALYVDGARIEPSLVWDRQKLFAAGPFAFTDENKQTAHWRLCEWQSYYKTIAGLYGNVLVNPLKSRACLLKPYQQVIAGAAGFGVPDTLVANRKSPILSFVSGRPAIIKSLSLDPVVPETEDPSLRSAIMTMSIPQEAVANADPAQLSQAPQLLQEDIDKLYELRVVVIDQTILPFRIRSQETPLSRTDWREGYGFVKFEPFHVTDQVASSLRRFMSSTGLFSGSFDLIVDKAERTWFIEVNQDGQWAWLDNIVDGAIANTFARAFVARARAGQLCHSFSRAI